MSEAELAELGMMRQFGQRKFEQQQGISMGWELARNFALLGGGDFAVRRHAPGPDLTSILKLMRTAG
jgi:hypothetical protein